MKDEQASYIIKACHGLSKISQIYFGRNRIGPKFVDELRNPSLSDKLEELSLIEMQNSPTYIAKTIDIL